jgi:poly(beta-D-mannuronate) lyase
MKSEKLFVVLGVLVFMALAVSTAEASDFSDNFNRADSTTLGNGWTEVAGDLKILSNEVRNEAISVYHIAIQDSLSGAAQTVGCDFARTTLNGGPRFGVMLRYQDSLNYYYFYRLTGGTARVYIAKIVNGTLTNLANTSLSNPTVNVLFRIEGIANGTTLKLKVDGVEKLSIQDSTFSSGKVGIQFGSTSNTDSHRADNFSAVMDAAPAAAFAGSPTSGSYPLTVNFTDQSTGSVTAWSWNFGDSGTSTLQNPAHIYQAAGAYTVSLTVSGNAGSDDEIKTNYITVTTSPAPVADFTGSPTSGVAPLTVNFTDGSTGTITAWSWTFGDGGTSTARNPSHIYQNAGTYDVSLTATGPSGTDIETKTGYITVSLNPPTAAFSGTPLTGNAPLTVNFTDSSTGGVTAWSWAFGDSGTSTAQNPSHQYTPAGTYTVSLTVTSPGGSDIETKTNYITVNQAPPTETWTTYNNANTGGAIGNNTILGAAVETGGTKWFGTNGGGMAKYAGTSWTKFTTGNSGLANNTIYAIALDISSNKWIATNSGVNKYTGTSWTKYTSANSGIASNATRAIAVDNSGDVWVGTLSNGLCKFNGTSWTTYTNSNSGLPDNAVKGIAVDSSNNKWIATLTGAAKYDGTTWAKWGKPPLLSDDVYAIAAAPNGNKWVGTTSAVSKFTGTSWTNYTTADGLAKNDNRAIAVDSDGIVWAGSAGSGLSKFTGATPWTIYNTSNSGLANNTVNAVAAESPFKLWFGTSGGVSLLQIPAPPPPPPGQASNPNPANGAGGVNVSADLSWTAGSGATSGDVYFGTANPPPFQVNQAATTFDPGTMSNSATYYWRIDEKNAGGTTTGVLWSFTTVASGGQAANPTPANGATNVTRSIDLQWSAGVGATSHNVYFGIDPTPDWDDYRGNQAGTTFDPGILNALTTYYWRIDEVSGSGTTTGVVWSFSTAAEGTIYYVSSAANISSAMASARPGDTLIMTNGTWTDQNIFFNGNGTASQPITLQAQTPGQVILNGNSLLHIGGSYQVVDGLRFDSGALSGGSVVEFRSGDGAHHCRLTNTAIVNYNPPNLNTRYFWVSFYGHDNRVDHCYLSGQSHSGVTCVVWRDDSSVNNHLIDHNYFGNRPVGPENGYETIRIGDSSESLSASRTTVEYNYFEHCDGEIEVVSNKSCENIYRYNTFVDNKGQLTLRHGNGCRVEGNFFFGYNVNTASGVRIIGENHLVINNYFAGLKGTGTWGAIVMSNGVPSPALDEYVQVKNAVVAFNTLVDCNQTFTIGLLAAGGDATLPPENCRIANNIVRSSIAPLIYYETAPINMTYEGDIMYGADLGIPNPGGIAITDPKLVLAADGLMRPDSTSPAINASVGSYPDVTIDMDGQARNDGTKDIGSDEVSGATITLYPLMPEDIGPNWWYP